MLRRVILGETGIETSCLGFGCASLGSRVPAEAGARALAAAIEAGVTWLDLAPVYGGGRAEEIAAGVIRGRRDRLQIATKVGLGLAGGAGGGLRRAVMPFARRAAHLMGGGVAARLRGAAPKANSRLPLTPDLLAGSLEASLVRLGTDHVDLFALHGVSAAEVGREEILRALEDLRASGKTRAVAVAGDASAAAAALAFPYGVLQLPLPAPGDTDGTRLLARARAAGRGLVTHSVFGPGGPDPALRARVAAAAGVPADGDGPARVLMARAFALNPEGVVLVSMFSDRSRAANLLAAAEDPKAAPRDLRGFARVPGEDPLAALA